VHFHDWRAARDRKAATRRLWRSRCSGLVTVPLSIGLATLVLAAGMSLVGREEDIELLRRRWRQVETGNGQVVLIAGEAGIGKSRLTAALFEDLAGAPHTRLRYFCSPLRGCPLDRSDEPRTARSHRRCGRAGRRDSAAD